MSAAVVIRRVSGMDGGMDLLVCCLVLLKYLNNCWMDCGAHNAIHVPLRINCDHFVDPLTFHVVPPSSEFKFVQFSVFSHAPLEDNRK